MISHKFLKPMLFGFLLSCSACVAVPSDYPEPYGYGYGYGYG